MKPNTQFILHQHNKRLATFIKTTVAMGCLALAGPTSAAEILWGNVGLDYYGNGQTIAGFLTTAGHNVTNRDLWTDDLSAEDLSVYDQIWVYDLSYTADDLTATHMTNYEQIANWFDSSTHDLIVDGRIISSHYIHSEPDWIPNYAEQLADRNHGLVLGTDHDFFVAGINQINNLIGVDPFWGNYHVPPLEAIVDVNSPLYDAAGTHACSFDLAQRCVWDDSSTSFVPTGQQTNPDIFLTPVAYHGQISPDDFSNAYDQAAVATTMGSITFGTCGGIDQPPCATPEPGTLALLALGGLAGIGFRRRNKWGRSQ